MQVGTIVRLKVHCLGNPTGTLGVCYDVYSLSGRPGYGLIFKNGDYDGFSPDEVRDCVEEVGFDESLSGYQFKNVIILSSDFANHKFDSVFKS